MNYPEMKFENEKCTRSSKSVLKAVIFGVLLVLVGGVLVGNKLGFIPDKIVEIIISWQALLIGLGLMSLTSRRGIFGGIILIVIGSLFMLPMIIVLPVKLDQLIFPIVLVTVGILVVIFSILRPKKLKFEHNYNFDQVKTDFSQDFINESYVFGGTNLEVKSQNFKGGNLEAVFGGGKVDLTKAVLSMEGKNVLNIQTVFGGFEIIVPADWNIVIQSTSVFGGFAMKKNGINQVNIDPTKELIITGTAVFGGAEIKRAY